jgi:transposase InsO family protein
MRHTKLIKDIYKQPDKEVKYPHLRIYSPDVLHEIDLLHFTEDKGFKYILSIIDVHNGLCDARALKKKEVENILHALEDIYDKNKYIAYPRCIQADKAFNNHEFKEWCDEREIKWKITETNNHRQNAHVERLNQEIGKRLWMLQVDEEIETEKPCTRWREWLPKVIQEMNDKKLKGLDKNMRRPEKPESEHMNLTDTNEELVQVGTRVRLRLTHPETIQGKSLMGEFRATDHKWRYQPTYEVIERLFQPGGVPLYRIRNITNNKVYNALLPREFLQII